MDVAVASTYLLLILLAVLETDEVLHVAAVWDVGPRGLRQLLLLLLLLTHRAVVERFVAWVLWQAVASAGAVLVLCVLLSSVVETEFVPGMDFAFDARAARAKRMNSATAELALAAGLHFESVRMAVLPKDHAQLAGLTLAAWVQQQRQMQRPRGHSACLGLLLTVLPWL
eukprot:gb/GFBE01076721.1/.p1 GENE.gb/GFBE01076721.1/~~gb/GFBE01076721.1/.p1  ORF type:complete len:170 (+),score=30.79 gb/GFBE01076721.1/:1-510(+)